MSDTNEQELKDWTGRVHEQSRECWCEPEVTTNVSDGGGEINATIRHNGNLSPTQEFNLVLDMEDVRSTKYATVANLPELAYQAVGEASTYKDQPEMLIKVAEGIVARAQDLMHEQLVGHYANRVLNTPVEDMTPGQLAVANKWANSVMEEF